MKTVSITRTSGKSTILFALIAATAIAVGLVAQHKTMRQTAMPDFDKLIMLPKSKPLGDVSFTSHLGDEFSAEHLKGKWTILFFAFTHCPDICPSTLHVMKQVKEELITENAWSAFQLAMVSVDPERDTPARMKQYVPFFDPEFIGLTGDLKYTEQFAKNLGILFFKGKTLDGGGYDVDHGASLILVNPDGQYAGVISAPHKFDSIASDLKKLGHYALEHQNIRTHVSAAKSPSGSDTVKTQAVGDHDLSFEGAWIRPAPPQAPSMAGYFTARNASDRDITIVGVSSPLFAMTMIHKTVIENGVASMEHMNDLTIQAGQTVTLAPQATHLMLMSPTRDLAVGTQVPIQLTLKSGDVVDVSIDVRDNPQD